MYHLLYGFFQTRDFEMLLQKKQFRKYMPNGFVNVILSHSIYEHEHWLEVNLGIRLENVEYIAQQFLDHLNEFHADANTLVLSVGKLTNNKYFRYKITDAEELKYTCNDIRNFLSETGLPFLESHASLAALNHLFNDDPAKPSIYVYNQTHRCFKGLVIAKLAMHPHFIEVAQTYHQMLIKMGAKPDLIMKYDRLANYLLHYSPN